MMEQEIHITLRFTVAIGKVSLNEIVYKLNELRDPLMVRGLDSRRVIGLQCPRGRMASS